MKFTNKQNLSTKVQRYTGFTLAEVLIVIGIIGMVANMTIPALMNDISNVQYVVALKKEYTVFNQALKQMALDSGCPDDLKCVDAFTKSGFAPGINISVGLELAKYIKIAKNCGTETAQGCFSSYTRMNYDKRPHAGDSNYDNMSDVFRFVSLSGASYIVKREPNHWTGAACYNYGGLTGHLSQPCGEVYVDVNGAKPPNAMGRDTFHFYISNGKGAMLYPYGGSEMGAGGWWDGTTKSCNSANPYGFFCTGRVIEDGWEMNY